MSHASFRRLWLVLCDHSFVGVHTTKRAAEDAVRLRQRNTISNIVHWVLGPFVLETGARAAELAPEWISRCSCGAIYRTEKEWSALAYVGPMDFEDGSILELRNCVACASTISRRVKLSKGAVTKRWRR